MRIPQDMQVMIFSDAGFSLNTKTFTADTPYVGDDFNDLTSSIQVVKANLPIGFSV